MVKLPTPKRFPSRVQFACLCISSFFRIPALCLQCALKLCIFWFQFAPLLLHCAHYFMVSTIALFFRLSFSLAQCLLFALSLWSPSGCFCFCWCCCCLLCLFNSFSSHRIEYLLLFLTWHRVTGEKWKIVNDGVKSDSHNNIESKTKQ